MKRNRLNNCLGLTNGWRIAGRTIGLLCVLGACNGTFPLVRGSAASVIRLGDLPQGVTSSRAFDVSDDGQVVVGVAETAEGDRAFRWTATEGMRWLDELPGWGRPTQATAVSGDGNVVVGMVEDAERLGLQAFRWSAASATEGLGDVGDMGAELVRSAALDVSADGRTIVGWGTPPVSPYQWAVQWVTNGPIDALGHLGGHFAMATAVSADGQFVVGSGRLGDCVQAFRWTRGNGMEVLRNLEGEPVCGIATGISADGQIVVGEMTRELGRREAFRWSRMDGMRGLGRLPGGPGESFARGASVDGSVIVGQASTDPGLEAFIWTAATGMVGLGEKLLGSGLDPRLAGWERLVEATAVSPDGRFIVGHGFRVGHTEEKPEAFLIDLANPEAPPPTLDLTRHGDELWLSWPKVHAEFRVLASDRLGPGAVWNEIVLRDAESPTSEDVFKVASEPGTETRFFRLVKAATTAASP